MKWRLFAVLMLLMISIGPSTLLAQRPVCTFLWAASNACVEDPNCTIQQLLANSRPDLVFQGEEQWQGRTCQVLLVLDPTDDSPLMELWVDAHSARILKAVAWSTSSQSEAVRDNYIYEDYRLVSGLFLPFRTRLEGDLNMHIVLKEAVLNPSEALSFEAPQ